MDIDNLFLEFFNEIARIEHCGAMAYETTIATLKNHAELAKNYQVEGLKDSPVGFRRTLFKSAETGHLVGTDGKHYSLEELENVYKENLNKQCQWLLVDAYEKFEKFQYQAYAVVGFSSQAKWKVSDFGSATTADAQGKPYEWFLDRVKEVYKNKADKVLTRMRSLYPDFAALEITNALEISLRLKVNFIEQIRHQIVHAGGYVADIGVFFEKIYQKTGVALSMNPGTRAMQMQSIYLTEDGISHRVFMFNRTTRLGPGLKISHSPLEMACHVLLAHAEILANRIAGRAVLGAEHATSFDA